MSPPEVVGIIGNLARKRNGKLNHCRIAELPN
jgi:hypothetical protein